jgi:hypothetical protein
VNAAERLLREALPLVRRKLGPVDPVQLIVTDERSLPRAVVRSEQAVLGTRRRPERSLGAGLYGVTTLAPAGLLVAVNGSMHTGDALELATTVVHELVHCWQLSADGARERKIRWLRNDYWLHRLSSRECREASRLIRQHEEQARELERLALRLDLRAVR